MTGTLVALPIDGRPVTCDQIALLARIAGWRVLLPPRQWLGRMRQPGDRDRLADWLVDAAQGAQGLVVSTDMLVYGGLVPSRLSDEDEGALADRLTILRRIRERFPALPVTAFAATMRISNTDHAEEERGYWARHGREIWQWSHHADRHAVHGDAQDAAAVRALEARIPAAVLADYRAVRARNFRITQRLVDWVAAGMLDFLVLPQDDTAPYGVNVAETRALVAMAAQRGITDRVASYPGADEVIWTMVARLIAKAEGIRPGFAIDWADPEAARAMVARYEDRPMAETLAAQIAAVGGGIAACGADGVTDLFVHTAGMQQGDWALDVWPDGPCPAGLSEWSDRLAARVQGGGRVGLLDLAHANGGDPSMIAQLRQRVALDHLHGYAGWNTAGNSIGSLVAICAVPERDPAARRRLLATRFVDDLVYQADLRQRIRASGIDIASPDGAAWAINAMFLPAAQAWLDGNGFADLTIRDAWFPWQRTFEIGCDIAGPASMGARE